MRHYLPLVAFTTILFGLVGVGAGRLAAGTMSSGQEAASGRRVSPAIG